MILGFDWARGGDSQLYLLLIGPNKLRSASHGCPFRAFRVWAFRRMSRPDIPCRLRRVCENIDVCRSAGRDA